MEQSTKHLAGCKTTMLLMFGFINLALFCTSLLVDYQKEILKEHTKFGTLLPTRNSWMTPPVGFLKSYLFSVTNAEAFLNGTDAKIKFEEIGPIVYRVQSKHVDLDINDNVMTYRKIRYESITFDESRSPPGILNRTITMPNFILLSSATEINDWLSFMKSTFNYMAADDTIFVNRTVQEFLWNFRTPLLSKVSKWLPIYPSNAGILHNALTNKDEIFNVNIGSDNGFKDFFRINSLTESENLPEYTKNHVNPDSCPIVVKDAFDGTIFTPYMKRDTKISIVVPDICRVVKLRLKDEVTLQGLDTYEYELDDNPRTSCLDKSGDYKLPYGLNDASKCSMSGTPLAYSNAHFSNTAYEWEKHFEGLHPNKDVHQSKFFIEPTTGVTIKALINLQASIPIPELKSFRKELLKFSGMIIPTFWYAYELDELPSNIQLLLKLVVQVVPIVQIVMIIVFAILAILSFLLAVVTAKDMKLRQIVCKIHNRSRKIVAYNISPKEMDELIKH